MVNNNNKGVLFLFMCLVLASSVFGLDAPNPVSPAQGAANLPTGILFNWTAEFGAEGYIIEVDTDAGFSSGNSIIAAVNNQPTPDTTTIVKDLLYGQVYYWRTRSFAGVVYSTWSNTVSFNTGSSAPSYVSPSNNAVNIPGGATLLWNAHEYVSTYDYEVDTVSSFNSGAKQSGTVQYANFGIPGTVSKNIGGAIFGQKYFWRIRSRNINGFSNWSNARNYTITASGPALSSPNDGTQNVLGGVLLNWNAQHHLTKYQYQVDTSASFISANKITGTTSYISTDNNGLDTQVEVGNLYYNTTHYWRIRSITSADTSSWSATRSFNTTASGPILTSPNDGVSGIKAGVTLDWNAHNYTTYYDYQYDTLPTFNSPVLLVGIKNYISTSSSNTDTKATIGDLFYGKTYYWRVRARNSRDASPWVTRSFVVDSTVKITGPADGTLNIQGAPTIDWESHNYVIGYQYQYDTLPDFSSTYLITGGTNYIGTSSTGADTKHTLFDFLFGKTYFWRVRSINLSDTSKWTAVNSFSITSSGPVQIFPANMTSGISASGITLDWNHQVRVSGYLLQFDKTDRFDSPAMITFNKTYVNATSGNPDTEQLISPLDVNKVYFWRVRTFNAIDSSAWSPSWAFSTSSSPIIMPGIPQLSLPLNAAGNQNLNMLIDWDAVSDVAFYDFEVDTTNQFNSLWKRSGSNTYISGASNNSDTEHILNNLSFNKTYHWRVRARTAFSNSEWSTIWSFSTQGTFIPDVPVQVSPLQGSTVTAISVLINWDAVNVASYYDLEVDRNINFNSPDLITVTKNYINASSNNPDTEHLLSNLNPNSTYFWRIRSRTGATNSAWSTILIFNSDGTTGVSQSANPSTTLNVFPNPSNGIFNLEIPNEMTGDIQVLVYGQGARIVYSDIIQKSNSESNFRVDLSDLPNGQYFIKMHSQGKIASQRFIKVH